MADLRVRLQAPFQNVAVEARGSFLVYWGSKHDLIAAGIAVESMFAPKEKRSTKRYDPDGDQYHLDSYFVRPKGQHEQRYKLWWHNKPRECALRFPGFANAIRLWEEHVREIEEHNRRYEEEREAPRREPSSPSEWKEKILATVDRLLVISTQRPGTVRDTGSVRPMQLV